MAPAVEGFHGLAFFAGRYDGTCASICDRVVALARVVCSVRGDFHICRDLIQHLGLHRRIADPAAGDLYGPDFQRLLIDTDMDLAPQAALRAPMLAGVPLTFAFGLDASSVDKQVQRPLRATVGNVHGHSLLAPAERAEIRHRPVQADQVQKALHEPGSLPERHAEEPGAPLIKG